MHSFIYNVCLEYIEMDGKSFGHVDEPVNVKERVHLVLV